MTPTPHTPVVRHAPGSTLTADSREGTGRDRPDNMGRTRSTGKLQDTEETRPAASNPDIGRLATGLQVEKRVKRARIVSATAGRLRRLIGMDTSRAGHAVMVRLTRSDTAAGGDHDAPAAIIGEMAAFEAGVRIGRLLVLEEDIENARRRGGVPPAGEIVRTGAGRNEIALFCHWWTRRRGPLGRIDKVGRFDRSDLLTHKNAVNGTAVNRGPTT